MSESGEKTHFLFKKLLNYFYIQWFSSNSEFIELTKWTYMPITGSNDRIIVNITVNYFDCHLSLNTRKFTDYSRTKLWISHNVSQQSCHDFYSFMAPTPKAESKCTIFKFHWHIFINLHNFYTHCFAIY